MFELLLELLELETELGRDIRRSDLHPPNPSWRAVARAFGSWQQGVALAREVHAGDKGTPRLLKPHPQPPASDAA
jgi:hypothetical protein